MVVSRWEGGKDEEKSEEGERHPHCRSVALVAEL